MQVRRLTIKAKKYYPLGALPSSLEDRRRQIHPKDPLAVGVGARIMNIKFVRNVNATLMFLSEDTIADIVVAFFVINVRNI